MSPNVSRLISASSGTAVLSLLTVLTGCSDSPAWGGWSKRPTPAQIEAVMARPLETFVYFSRYEVYQNEHTREYVYRENDEWVRSVMPPPAVSEAKLQASPFVVLSLRNGPGESYAKVRKQYPSDLEKNPSLVAAVP